MGWPERIGLSYLGPQPSVLPLNYGHHTKSLYIFLNYHVYSLRDGYKTIS